LREGPEVRLYRIHVDCRDYAHANEVWKMWTGMGEVNGNRVTFQINCVGHELDSHIAKLPWSGPATIEVLYRN
jgi:hypothetical protein